MAHHKAETTPVQFPGTDNPRYLRAIAELLRRPIPRESLDRAVGCSNGPDLIAGLRRLGLEAPCERIEFIDRDNQVCRPGVYSLTQRDRNSLYRWMASRKGGNHG
jgi:hypothetical protein